MRKYLLIGISFLLTFHLHGQVVSNLISGYNIDRGLIEISFDFNSDNYQPYEIELKLKQLEDNLIIDIPKENINPSMERVYPGERKKIEVSLANLTLEGEFIAILKPLSNQIATATLPVKEILSISTPPLIKETKSIKIEETKAIVVEKPKSQQVAKVVPGFTIKAKNFQELSALIKSNSEKIMVNGDLTPNNLNIDFSKMTFSCDFIEENSGLVKIGLYYGTTEKGCESCMNVLLKNTDSIVIKEITYSKFVFNLIAIHK